MGDQELEVLEIAFTYGVFSQRNLTQPVFGVLALTVIAPWTRKQVLHVRMATLLLAHVGRWAGAQNGTD